MITEFEPRWRLTSDFRRTIAAIGRGDYPQLDGISEPVGDFMQKLIVGKRAGGYKYRLWFPAVEIGVDEISKLTINQYDHSGNLIKAPFGVEEHASFYLSNPGSVWGRIFNKEGSYNGNMYRMTRDKMEKFGWWDYLDKYRPEYLAAGKLLPQICLESELFVGSIFARRTEFDYFSQKSPVGIWGVFDKVSYLELCRQINQIGKALDKLDHHEED